jgi:GxxExxY protein
MKTQIATADFADDADCFLVITLMLNTYPQTYRIIGAAIEVHRELGNEFVEPIYHEALKIEFDRQGIEYVHEAPMQIYYKGARLSSVYRADFLCLGSIIVELKALREVGKNEYAQVINYLNAARLARGLLINFGSASLEYRRFILSKYESA